MMLQALVYWCIMEFNSLTFAVFLLVVFAVHWFMLNRRGWTMARNLFLLAVSYVFYGAWDWRFLSLIAFSSAVDFWVGLRMDGLVTKSERKPWLVVSLVVNLGLLAAFKYFDFFLDSAQDLAALFGWDGERLRLNWILPVGISFYTFQTLSYSLDLYHGRMKATRDPVAFFAFVAFFPQLVAGPIERARNLLPHFERTSLFDSKAVRSGLFLLLWGLFKKVVLADRLALFVNQGYAHSSELDSYTFILLCVFFPWQLYLDFSAYSDIAIGSARMLGFPLTTNFRQPMFSVGFSDFWNRWHITLTRWFRDYLYNAIRKVRPAKWWKAMSVMVVFTATGFWHGATWNFIFWGVLCGLALLVIEPWISNLSRHKPNKWGPRLLGFAITTVYMYGSLIWFRAPDVDTALEVYGSIGKGWGNWAPSDWNLTRGEYVLAWLGIGLAAAVDLVLIRIPALPERFMSGNGMKRWALSWLLVMGIILAGSYGININDEEFIYFQF